MAGGSKTEAKPTAWQCGEADNEISCGTGRLNAAKKIQPASTTERCKVGRALQKSKGRGEAVNVPVGRAICEAEVDASTTGCLSNRCYVEDGGRCPQCRRPRPEVQGELQWQSVSQPKSDVAKLWRGASTHTGREDGNLCTQNAKPDRAKRKMATPN